MRVLVTGASGFIGHHVVQALVANGHEVVGLDRIDGTSSMDRLREVAPEARFVWHDLKSPVNNLVARLIGPVDTILHLAAATHVDRSIQDATAFVLDNVLGTAHILEYARTQALSLFLNFSTDEVFGPAAEGHGYGEWDRYDPKNPYAATKAAAVEIAEAYRNTFKIPVVTTHCMNVFGERQHPEKFVPLVIRSVIRGDAIPIHCSPDMKPGSRFYIHSSMVAEIMVKLVEGVKGDGELHLPEPGFPVTGVVPVPRRLNIPGLVEVDNLDMARRIAKIAGKELNFERVDFHSDRPGHDLRYGLDDALFRNLFGVWPKDAFDQALEKTVKWYVENPSWLLI